MSKKIIIGIIISIALNSHATVNVWKDGEFLLWSYGKRYIPTTDFCFALRYENEKIGNPICYEAGDWERDTTAMLYAKWLNANLDSRLTSEDLRPRNPHIVERLRNLKDKSLIFSTAKDGKLWFLLFDENNSYPSKIATFPATQDSSSIAKKIASDWFSSTPQRRLSDSERAAKEKEPDEYFAEQPMHDVWIGAGLGYSRAKVPLTPSSWYKSKLNSRIKNYREVKDSASAWSFIDDSAPFYNIYVGGSLYDFIGAELGFHTSKHNAKIDENDRVYEELDHWSFRRYEILLSLMFMKVFMPIPQIEIEPYTSMSIIYSFFTEDIAGVTSQTSKNYDARIKFEDHYTGVALNFGLRTAFFKNYALDLRTGIANRGTSMVTQEIIGSSTTDVYVAASLEYHFRWR
jgi:hypothetical protein